MNKLNNISSVKSYINDDPVHKESVGEIFRSENFDADGAGVAIDLTMASEEEQEVRHNSTGGSNNSPRNSVIDLFSSP